MMMRMTEKKRMREKRQTMGWMLMEMIGKMNFNRHHNIMQIKKA
jgi:hypothetical protein